MPISGDQQLDKNQRRFGMPLDSCVGDDGPTPTEVTTISGKDSGPLSGYDAVTVPVGYDGP